MSPQPESAVQRPRIEGDRETEILEATIEVLVDVGYDRLTMDAVAHRARASKATLYRRWNSKLRLVMDALLSMKTAPETPDTGSLRGDLLSLMCGQGGVTDHEAVGTFGAVLTAIVRDPEFADAFRAEFVGPKIAASREIWERARDRGEVSPDLDLDLFEPALAGILLHRVFLIGEQPTEELISRVVDQIILPAALTPSALHHLHHPEENL